MFSSKLPPKPDLTESSGGVDTDTIEENSAKVR